MQLDFFPEHAEHAITHSEEYHECPICNEVKHKSHFYVEKRILGSTWLKVSEGCKPCYRENQSLLVCLRKEAPPKTESCECCGRNFKEHGIKAELDHCHTEKTFKGWLCSKCNGGLGRFNDDVDLLNKAISYLLRKSDGQ